MATENTMNYRKEIKELKRQLETLEVDYEYLRGKTHETRDLLAHHRHRRGEVQVLRKLER